jgi:tetratricopeptide (TPR) repeat protein
MLLCLCGITPALYADTLAELPAALAARLQPVPVIALDALDADSRAQLVVAREHAAAALAATSPDRELADAYGELGALYQVLNVFSPARTCYENAMQLAPDEFRWVYYAAWLDIEIGELERAISGFRRAREIRPDYLALSLRMADAWRELDELAQAEQAYLAVLDAEGLQAAAHYGLGQIALLRRDNAAAIAHFRQTLVLQPEANRVHYSLAQALRASGQPEAARQHLEQMGDRLPVVTDPQIESLEALRQGATVHFLHAMKAYRKQDYAGARDSFAAGLALEPDNVNARISYARSLYLTGDRTQALQTLDRALELDGSSALAHFLAGIITEEEGDHEAAMRHYSAALQTDPEHSGALLYLGNAEYRRGRLEQAAGHYAHSIATATDNPGAYLALCGVLLQTGQPGQARTLLGDALQHFPELQVLEYLQIQLQALSGDDALIRQAADAAGRLVATQDIPPHRELQALTLAASGDFEAALAILQALAMEASWGMPAEGARLERAVAACKANRLPGFADLFTQALLQPPPVQGRAVFLAYPAPRPY